MSDHVVVLDGGRLLRASRTDEFLDATGILLVEVLGDDGTEKTDGRGLVRRRASRQHPRGGMLTVDGRRGPTRMSTT